MADNESPTINPEMSEAVWRVFYHHPGRSLLDLFLIGRTIEPVPPLPTEAEKAMVGDRVDKYIAKNNATLREDCIKYLGMDPAEAWD